MRGEKRLRKVMEEEEEEEDKDVFRKINKETLIEERN
jgi:hypothetical protein